MDFSTIITKNIKGVGTVQIRPYLTTAEIDAILEIASEQKTYGIRCALIDIMVMHHCTNIKDFAEENINIDTYDIYKSHGVIDAVTKEISGYDVLFAGLKDLSIKDIYMRFEDVINEFTKEFKNINFEEQQKKFENTLNELKKVEIEKEAILNG